MFLLLLIIGLLGLYVIPMNNLTYYILTGIIAGIGISIKLKFHQNITNKIRLLNKEGNFFHTLLSICIFIKLFFTAN